MTQRAIQRFVKIQADSQGNPPTRIHLMSTGHWHAPWHGNFEMTPEDLAEMVQHFEDGVGVVEGSNKLPINYGHDISGKAAGWITKLTVENDGTELWGDVEWTPEGLRMLAEGEFRYISPEWNPRSFPYQDPEDEDTWLNNVFTGAGLTNIPLFKKLKPIMASIVAPKTQHASVVTDDSNNSKGEPMDLAALRGKKPEELSDDEKKFVADNAAELNPEERKAFDIQTDEDKAAEAQAEAEAKAKADAEAAAAAEAEEANKGEGQQANGAPQGLSASEIAQLKADAQAGREALAKLADSEARSFVAAAVKDGRIKTGESENTVKLLLASKGDQRKSLEAFINGLPKNDNLGKEFGDGGNDATGAAAHDELHTKVIASIKASADKGKNLPYSQARKYVLAADKALAARVKEEEKENQ